MLNKNTLTFLECDKDFADARTVLFGAPFDSTTSFRPGTRFGPHAVRSESFGLESYSPYLDRDLIDAAVLDTGDVECLAVRTEKDYFVEAFIPTPYRRGVTRFNAFRIEREGADKPYLLYAVFPTLCETFHVPEKMGLL